MMFSMFSHYHSLHSLALPFSPFSPFKILSKHNKMVRFYSIVNQPKWITQKIFQTSTEIDGYSIIIKFITNSEHYSITIKNLINSRRWYKEYPKNAFRVDFQAKALEFLQQCKNKKVKESPLVKILDTP